MGELRGQASIFCLDGRQSIPIRRVDAVLEGLGEVCVQQPVQQVWFRAVDGLPQLRDIGMACWQGSLSVAMMILMPRAPHMRRENGCKAEAHQEAKGEDEEAAEHGHWACPLRLFLGVSGSRW